MKKFSISVALVACGLAFTTSNLAAADAKDYQVTGPVLEVNATYIVVQKGEQKWQLATDSTTKGAKPKVGDKVTVHYSMTATDIEVKADKAKADAAPEKKAEKK